MADGAEDIGVERGSAADRLTRERSALERLAYGRSSADEAAREAQRALQALRVPAHDSPSTTRHPSPQESSVSVAAPPPSAVPLDPELPPLEGARPGRRRPLALVTVVAAVVIGVAGFAAGLSAGSARAHPDAATASAKATSTNPSDPNDDHVVLSALTVGAWFGTQQSSADRLPAEAGGLSSSLEGSSSRLAIVDRSLNKLWIVKEKAPESGFCLVAEDRTPGVVGHDLACATKTELVEGGLTLSWSGGEANWTSTQLTNSNF